MTLILPIALGLCGAVGGFFLERVFKGKWAKIAWVALLLAELIILQQIPGQTLLLRCIEVVCSGVVGGILIRWALRLRRPRTPTDIHGQPLRPISEAERFHRTAEEFGGRAPRPEEMAEILAMAAEAERMITDLQGQAARGELEEVEIFPPARWRWIALWRTMNWVGIPIVLALLDGMLIPKEVLKGVLMLNPDLVYLVALGVFVVLLGAYVYSQVRYHPLPRVFFMFMPAILSLVGIASAIYYLWFLH